MTVRELSRGGRWRAVWALAAALALTGVLLPAAGAAAAPGNAPVASIEAVRAPAATSLQLSLALSLGLSSQTAPDPSGSGAGVVLRPADEAAQSPATADPDPEALTRPTSAQVIEDLAVLCLLALCALWLGRRHRSRS